MRRWRELCALSCGFLMIGLMAGVCDPEGVDERHVRGHRIRHSRSARPDFEVTEVHHDELYGRNTHNLALQFVPDSLPDSNSWHPAGDSAPIVEFAPELTVHWLQLQPQVRSLKSRETSPDRGRAPPLA